MRTLDLSAPPRNHTYTVSLCSEEKKGDRFVRLAKEIVLVGLAAGFVILIGWICVQALFSTHSTAEEKKWAMSTITAISGGLVGYLIHSR
jgi:uncharacterized membrane protein